MECEICGDIIPKARLKIVPETTLCVICQSDNDIKRYMGLRSATNEDGQVTGCENDIIRNQDKLKNLKFPTRRVCK